MSPEQRPFDPDGVDHYSAFEFANNTEQRCPCVLVLDCSGSMQGRCIDEINRAIERFAEDLRGDDLASKRVDIAVITFGNEVKVLHDFTSARSFVPQRMGATGATPLGEALCQAVQMIERRKASMKDAGIPHYRPWLVVMTDGEPTDRNSQFWQTARQLVSAGVDAHKFTFFPLITEDGNKALVQELSPRSTVRGLDSHKFSEFFFWLTGTLLAVSRSQIGGQAVLPPPGDWIIDV